MSNSNIRPINRRTFHKIVGSAAVAALLAPKYSRAAEGKVIAYLTIAVQIAFLRTVSKGIESVIQKNGGKFVLFDSKDSAQVQFQNAQDAIARKVDGIIICPTDSATCAPVLAEAKKAGIPVVIEDIGTTGGEYVSYISSDNYHGAYETTKVLTKEMAAKGWGKGTAGVIAVSLARINGQARTKGFRDAIAEAGIKEVALSEMQTYTTDETYKFTQDMLTAQPDMRGLFIEADEPAMGGLRAIKTSRRQDSLVFIAFDGIPEMVDPIKSGAIAAAGMQQPYLLGVRAAEAMFAHLAGETPPKNVEVPVLVVTKDNIDEMLPTIKKNVFGEQT
jgi:ribose transport system substrate-binding protein